MPGMFRRSKLIARAKTSKLLDKYEDPRETLDYSYQKQLELLHRFRRGMAQVATSRKIIERQIAQAQGTVDTLQAQAETAMALNPPREDLARACIARKVTAEATLADLQPQLRDLQIKEEEMRTASTGLQERVDRFRHQKETIKAHYTAAEAQAQAGEAFAGIGDEWADIGMAMQRAVDKANVMQARAGAVNELLDAGAFGEVTSGDTIALQLQQAASDSAVDTQMAALRAKHLPAIAADPEAQTEPSG